MSNKDSVFTPRFKVLLVILIVMGFVFTGLGLGMLLSKVCEFSILFFGIGILVSVLALVKIEYNEY